MKKPLISVIIPVYNGENSIEKCIESVLNQEYSNIEIIIINDGSTDNTNKIISKYNDRRIKIINQNNSGVSTSRNNGLEIANGDYITFIDSDDFVDKKFLKSALKRAVDNDLDIVIGGVQKVFNNKRKNYIIDNYDLKIYNESDLCELEKKIIGYNCNYMELNNVFFSGPVCKLFKKECIKNNRFVSSIKNGEDTLFNLDVIRLCKKIGIINEIWYYYIINSQSATQRYNSNAENESIKLLKELRKRINSTLMGAYYSRAIRQIDGIMTMYPFNEQSGFNYTKMRKYIKGFRKRTFWNKMFKDIELKQIRDFRYRMVAFLFKYNLYLIIIFYYKLLIKKRKKEVK